jgi:predicted RNA-binding Zn-ribbon protein involved in translation (DUF1610 family)
MSRIMVYTETIWFECPECGKKNVTDNYRPNKCEHCGIDLSYEKYIRVEDC